MDNLIEDRYYKRKNVTVKVKQFVAISYLSK